MFEDILPKRLPVVEQSVWNDPDKLNTKIMNNPEGKRKILGDESTKGKV